VIKKSLGAEDQGIECEGAADEDIEDNEQVCALTF